MTVKKKKGSSMITIVVMFAVLITIGITTLSLLTADYQRRIVSSKKTQNLYASDSGINVVSGAMQKVVEQAVKRGNEAANDFLTSDLSAYTNSDGSINKASVDTEVNSRFKTTYKAYITSYLNDSGKKTKLTNGIYVDDAGNDHLLYDTTFSNKPTITLDFGGGNANFTTVNSKELLNIKVTSSFSKTPLSGETSNLKEVTAVLTISAAEYNKTYGVNSKSVTIEVNPIWKNAISIDGNMKIKSSVNISGDVFVKGNSEAVNEKVYTKYNGGIIIGSDDELSANAADIDNNKVSFNGKVITGSSFNINGQNRLVEVLGNIYARNVYVGKSEKTLPASQNALNCVLNVTPKSGSEADTGAVYTINDLCLNASASKINIDKYYGVNDINKQSSFRPGIDSDFNSSSSIIVNTDDIGKSGGSSINIATEAVIMGAAYVNTNPAYQTGESVAIKGNYMAYSQPIGDAKITEEDDKVYGESNIILGYYDPLQFADKFKNNAALTIVDKARYMELVDALKLLPGNNGIKKAGIQLPSSSDKLINSGIAISNGKIVSSNYRPELDSRIIKLKEGFAKKVYEMDNLSKIGVQSPLDINDVYAFGKINKTVFTGDDNPDYGSDNSLKNPVKQVILDGSIVKDTRNGNNIEFISDSKDVIILGKNAGVSFENNDTTKVITAGNGPISGIIITKKNIKVYGEVNFSGTILAGGDFVTQDTYKKSFSSNDDLVMKLIAGDYDNIYKKIFNYNYSIGTHVVTISNSASSSAVETGEAFQSDLIKVGNWKIVK